MGCIIFIIIILCVNPNLILILILPLPIILIDWYFWSLDDYWMTGEPQRKQEPSQPQTPKTQNNERQKQVWNVWNCPLSMFLYVLKSVTWFIYHKIQIRLMYTISFRDVWLRRADWMIITRVIRDLFGFRFGDGNYVEEGKVCMMIDRY